MKADDTKKFESSKARIEERLDPSWQPNTESPVLLPVKGTYEVASRIRATKCGGIGLIQELTNSIGLAKSIDERLRLLQAHRPYHESDHCLSLTYNILAGGTCLQDLEILRNDESYLDILGARRIPDPTTSGDFLRRFSECDVWDLMEAINDARLRVWELLPRQEKKLAIIDVDGTHAPTDGECKEGMDINYKASWGYSPLIVSLSNTQEVLFIKNRPGNATSHCDAPRFLDEAIQLSFEGGFRRVRLRGDTDFSLTEHFDGWHEAKVEFVFGMDAHPTFSERASRIPESCWKPLERRRGGKPKAKKRRKKTNVKKRIVAERGYKNLVLEEEHVAEFQHQPKKCKRAYRMTVLRKTITVSEGQLALYPEVRYFFYITNVAHNRLPPHKVVAEANARCHQENIIEQLKNGVRALRLPTDTLTSNWAYMVLGALAWNFKAWLSMAVPQSHKAAELRRMEFRRFLNSVMLFPCQVIQTGRRVVLRILRFSTWIPFVVDSMDHVKRQRLV